jgi:hypothetical protein
VNTSAHIVLNLAALTGGRRRFSSALLHVAFDLPLHHEDAHRHFFPLSEWRFASPVSYWNPAYHRHIGALFETAVVTASSALLWPRFTSRGQRALLVLLPVLYAAGYGVLYVGGAIPT